MTFIDVFLKNVEIHSDKAAISDDTGSCTYQELNRLSNGVAAKLIGQGIGTGDIVPILMTRSKAFVAAFIGVMKSGAAFVPLDINYPEGRIKSIEESVEARIVINDEWMKDVSPSEEYVNNSKTDDIAFIIFTSGSTGKPKGVVHTHKSAAAMAKAEERALGLANSQKFLSILPFHFIGAINDYISYLSVGGTTYIASELDRKDGDILAKIISSQSIDRLKCGSSMGRLLLEHYNISIPYLEVGSEKLLPLSTINSSKVINNYGCSEFALPAIINDNVSAGEIPSIGKPVSGVDVFLVDNIGNLVDNYEVGEICLVGPQMASGYWKMPELTAEKFVHCPFLPGDVKMYKTGDLARYREDGNIELVGRKDFQIKIRGFRIEPGEVENIAVKFDGIDTVVVVSKEIGKEQQLVLYYTAEVEIDERSLKKHLSKYLADYMVPHFYVHLDEMPRNANGKIDRNNLPKPESVRNMDLDKPKTEIERFIFDTVAKQIGINCFSVYDHFHDLGMTSLGALYLINEMKVYGYDITINEIEAYDSVRQLSSLLCRGSIYKDPDYTADGASIQATNEGNDAKELQNRNPTLIRAFRYLKLIIKITRLHPRSLLQFIRYNSIREIIRGDVVLPSINCVIHIDKNSQVFKKGVTTIGYSTLFPSSKVETRLTVERNAKLFLHENNLIKGVDISVRNNASLSFGKNARVSLNSFIECLDKIEIGEDVAIGCNVFIRDSNGVGHCVEVYKTNNTLPIRIGSGAWLCEGCKILKGVTIGEKAIVGTGAVVYKNVPNRSVAFGNPAESIGDKVSFTL